MEVEGAWPMAIKIPSRGSSDVVPSLLLATITFSTWFPPLTSLTSEFQITFNLGSDETFCCIASEALNASLLWIIVTSVAYFARVRASSMAESPPPTTATFLSLKNGASQGAQDDAPLPIKSLIPGASNHLVSAPTATIAEFARYLVPPATTSNGFLETSMLSAFFSTNSAPKETA